MKIAILGTGMVGKALGTKLVELGHDVVMGSRTADNDNAVAWAESAGDGAGHGTFADAAAHGEIALNCTAGVHSMSALEMAGAENLADKILIDIANPLDFSNGFPPTLSICNDNSLAETIQQAYPATRVVKALSTTANSVMIDPGSLPGESTMFVCGNDEEARATVRSILEDWFGWTDVIDLGDISNARGMEQLLPIWVRLWKALGTEKFNFKIVR